MSKKMVTVESALDEMKRQIECLKTLAQAKSKYLGISQTLSSEQQTIDAKIAECDLMAQLMFGSVKQSFPPPAVTQTAPECLGDLLIRLFSDIPSFTIATAVKVALDAGYKTKSKNFRDVVGVLFRQDARFKRVRRGIYRINCNTGVSQKTIVSQPAQKTDNKIYFIKRGHKQGKDMATFIYKHAPKGIFTVAEAAKLMKQSGATTKQEVLSRSISARLGEDCRFRHVSHGTWVRVFPGNW